MFELLRADLMRYYQLTGRPRQISKVSTLLAFLIPRMLPVGLYRLSFALNRLRLAPLGKLVSLLNLIIFGLEIPQKLEIGPGFFLPHSVGTVIGAASIGANVTIFQGVTLGAKTLDMNYQSDLRPVIGNDVVISAGAKIIGGVMIGAGAVIGANAVVISDVPAGAVAVGVPAKYFYPDSKKIVGN